MLHTSTRVVLALALLCAAAPLSAQERPRTTGPDPDWELPVEIAVPIIERLNAPGTLVVSGRSRVPAGTTIAGDLAVVGGSLTLAGRVEGWVIVVDGDAELLPGAEIEGDLTVAGGAIFGFDDGRIGGRTIEHTRHLRYRRIDERFELDVREAEPRVEVDRDVRLTRAEFLIASGSSYNRVEGMPITLGPVIETAGSNPLHLRAMAIYRTESGATLNTDALGYHVRAEQFVGGRRGLRVGASVKSVVDPIEDWHLLNLENSLSTFLFHRDFRDHFERRGWSAFATLDLPRRPWELTILGSWERHASLPTGSPWSLFRNQEAWRAQPLVGDGSVSLLGVKSRYDTRSTAADPAHGWYATGSVERTIHADLVRRAAIRVGPFPIEEPEFRDAEHFTGWTHGFVDVRRYNRLGPEARLNLRLLAGGSLDGNALPPQRQHALGGEGSLPGYSLFGLDCGARDEQVFLAEALPTPIGTGRSAPPIFHTAYGCDRVALVQAEYRRRLRLRFGWEGGPWGEGDGGGWDLAWAAAPEWVAFFDAGHGWARGRRSEDLSANLGFGLLFNRVGVYAAAPLSGEGGVNLFVRLGPRF
jgi:hypothetical protein